MHEAVAIDTAICNTAPSARLRLRALSPPRDGLHEPDGQVDGDGDEGVQVHGDLHGDGVVDEREDQARRGGDDDALDAEVRVLQAE